MEDNQDYFIKGNFITRQRLSQSFLKNNLTRYIAYFLQTFLFFFIIFVNRFLNKSSKTYKHKISLCGIFKNEAKYLDEWIKYHLVIGIDHFYLYNNNSDDNYIEILQPYIDKGFVDLIDWPFNQAQMDAYKDCYNKNRTASNWLTFIDIDEFICPITDDDIKSWLSGYENYPGVAVYWKQFGSNGKLVHNNKKLVIEQYTQCWPKHSTFTKMFCNMNFPIVEFENMHLLSSKIYGIKTSPINQYKKIINFGINRTSIFNKNTIQINHYWGRAYDCFQEKLERTDAHYEDSFERKHIRERLLKTHESMCTDRDFTIQRFLLYTKLKSIL